MRTEPLLSKYNSLLRDIINNVAGPIDGDFLSKAKKRFGFESEDGWAFLTASLDLVGDTEDAKQDFYRFGLDGPTRIDNLGEKYLRLYGIVNAAYLQLSGLATLGELLKIPNKKQHDSRLRGLRLFEFRHIVGSHTVNYKPPTSKKKEAYMVAQFSLSDDTIQVFSGDNMMESYHLRDLLHEYDSAAQEYFEVVIEKALTSLFASNSKDRPEFQNQLELIRAEREGSLIIITPSSAGIPTHVHIVQRVSSDSDGNPVQVHVAESKDRDSDGVPVHVHIVQDTVSDSDADESPK